MSQSDPASPFMPWYRVPEVWLILILLGATIIGSFALLAEATNTSDRHIVVPNDVPRPSRIPPINPAAPDAAKETRDHGSAS